MLELQRCYSLWRKDSLWRGFLVSAGGVIRPDVLGSVGAEVVLMLVLSTAAIGRRRCTVSWTTMFLFPPWGDMVGPMDSTPHGRGSFVARIGSSPGVPSADLQHASTDWSAGGWVRDLGGLHDVCDIPQCKVFFPCLFWSSGLPSVDGTNCAWASIILSALAVQYSPTLKVRPPPSSPPDHFNHFASLIV